MTDTFSRIYAISQCTPLLRLLVPTFNSHSDSYHVEEVVHRTLVVEMRGGASRSHATASSTTRTVGRNYYTRCALPSAYSRYGDNVIVSLTNKLRYEVTTRDASDVHVQRNLNVAPSFSRIVASVTVIDRTFGILITKKRTKLCRIERTCLHRNRALPNGGARVHTILHVFNFI